MQSDIELSKAVAIETTSPNVIRFLRTIDKDNQGIVSEEINSLKEDNIWPRKSRI